jgi:hypothetical protein
MVNIQSVLLRFAEPFMDARYTKVCLFVLSVNSGLPHDLLLSFYYCECYCVHLGFHSVSTDGPHRSLLFFSVYPN